MPRTNPIRTGAGEDEKPDPWGGLEMGVLAEDGNVRVVQMDVSGGIVSNGYMLVCQRTGESVVIDTPGDADTILKQARETSPKYA